MRQTTASVDYSSQWGMLSVIRLRSSMILVQLTNWMNLNIIPVSYTHLDVYKRQEKIRTYNFPQGRVTDHRIKLTLHKLDSILNGDLDEVIDSLIAADQAAKLSNMNE